MKIENPNRDPKIKANAVSAYLLLFVSIFFLWNKNNKYINNDFVKSHVKTAFFIHISFMINYFVFVSNRLFGGLFLFDFSVNEIITKAIFLGLLICILIGIYKANSGKSFRTLDILYGIKSKPEKIIDVNGDGKFGEKDKVTILLSYIPIIGCINYARFRKNRIIQNNTKLNLIITVVVLLLYIYGHINLANLMMLGYTVCIAFIGINMFTRDEIITFNLDKIPSFQMMEYILKSLCIYTKNYFSKKDFSEFAKIVASVKQKEEEQSKKDGESLKTKKELQILPFLVYIPYINLIFLFIRNTRYSIHIKSGVTITFMLLGFQFAGYFGYYDTSFNIFLFIPVLFGIGYCKNDLTYRMPFVYNISECFLQILRMLRFTGKKMNTIRKKETHIRLESKK